MSNIGVHLRVDHGITSTQLHDEWLRLFHASNEAAKVAGQMWQEWKNATAEDGQESVESRQLWAEYSALQSDYRVLTAWRDLLHTAWVFPPMDASADSWLNARRLRLMTRWCRSRERER